MKKIFIFTILSVFTLSITACSNGNEVSKDNNPMEVVSDSNMEENILIMSDLSEITLNAEGEELLNSYYPDSEEKSFALRKLGKTADLSFLFNDKYPELTNKNKIILFAKTTCPSCADLMPVLESKASDTPIVYIFLRNTVEEVTEELEDLNLEMPQYIYTKDDLLDTIDVETAIEKVNLYAVPSMLLVNDSNRISYVYIGGNLGIELENIKRVGFEGTGISENKFLYEYCEK